MGCQNCQSPSANCISRVANDKYFVPWEVGNLAVVLLVLGVTISDNACDLVLDCLREVLNCAVTKSSTLTKDLSV